MFSRHRSHYCCRIEPNDESGKRTSMMRKLALRGRVKGVRGITQQIGECGGENVCMERDREREEESRREGKGSGQRGDRRSGVNTIIFLRISEGQPFLLGSGSGALDSHADTCGHADIIYPDEGLAY